MAKLLHFQYAHHKPCIHTHTQTHKYTNSQNKQTHNTLKHIHRHTHIQTNTCIHTHKYTSKDISTHTQTNAQNIHNIVHKYTFFPQMHKQTLNTNVQQTIIHSTGTGAHTYALITILDRILQNYH